MGRNAVHEILKIDTQKVKFPLLMSFNFVVNTPITSSDQEASHFEEDTEHTGDQGQNNVVDVPAAMPRMFA